MDAHTPTPEQVELARKISLFLVGETPEDCARALPKIAAYIAKRDAEIERPPKSCDSNLVRHAETELRLAGLYDAGSDYGGMIPENVVAIIREFASAGHSGGSASLTSEIVCRLMRFKTLTPITSDPAEWMEVSAMCPPDQRPVYQNRRDSAMFSNDGGKTAYSVDDPARVVKPTAEPRK